MRRPLAPAFTMAALMISSLALIRAPAQAAVGNGAEHSASGKVDPVLGQIEAYAQMRTPATAPRSTSAAPDPCSWQSGALFSYLQRAPQPSTRTDADGVQVTLYARVCGPTDITYYWVRATPAAQQVAALAMSLARQRIPAPDGVFTPDLRGGQRVVVHAPLRFAVRSWAPTTATASVAGVTATVTATPRALAFSPGDGSPALGCTLERTRPQSASPCTYSYRNASSVAPNGRSWPARLQMTWAVAWAASTGDEGTLPDVMTEASYDVAVGEIQAVEQAS